MAPLVAVNPRLSSTGLVMTGLEGTLKSGAPDISEIAQLQPSMPVKILRSPSGRMLETISK